MGHSLSAVSQTNSRQNPPCINFSSQKQIFFKNCKISGTRFLSSRTMPWPR